MMRKYITITAIISMLAISQISATAVDIDTKQEAGVFENTIIIPANTPKTITTSAPKSNLVIDIEAPIDNDNDQTIADEVNKNALDSQLVSAVTTSSDTPVVAEEILDADVKVLEALNGSAASDDLTTTNGSGNTGETVQSTPFATSNELTTTGSVAATPIPTISNNTQRPTSTPTLKPTSTPTTKPASTQTPVPTGTPKPDIPQAGGLADTYTLSALGLLCIGGGIGIKFTKQKNK